MLTDIIALEEKGEMDKVLAMLEECISKDKTKVELWIRYLFDGWYVLLEPDFDHLDIDRDLLEKHLHEHFKEAYELFSADASFMFYIGYIIGICDWYLVDSYKVNGEALGRDMIKRAYELEPNNIIYKYFADAYSLKEMTVTEKEERVKLYSRVKQSDLWIEGGLIGNYFDEIYRKSPLES